MAATATMTVGMTVTGGITGQVTYGPATAVSNTAATELVTTNAVINGNLTITVPTGALGVVIVPPSTNTTVTLVLKGIAGDTGVNLSPNTPTAWPFDPNHVPANFVLTGSGNLTVLTRWA